MKQMLLVTLLAAAPAANKIEPDDVVPNAAGVCLAEVVSMTEYDDRSGDGDAGIEVELRPIRSSGYVMNVFWIHTGHSPWVPLNRRSKEFPGPIRPNSIAVRKRYWIAFSSVHDWNKHGQGIIAFWNENDASVKDRLEAAIKSNRYEWSPQFHPESGLTHSHKMNDSKSELTVRVERDRKVLWETKLSRSPPSSLKLPRDQDPPPYRRYTMPESPISIETEAGKYRLRARTVTTLSRKNDFELPLGDYGVSREYDLESGKLLAFRIRLNRDVFPFFRVQMVQDYDPHTGNNIRETREDLLETGGKAVGENKDAWWRKIERTYEAKSGKLKSEEYSRNAEINISPKESEYRWVKINKPK